MNQFRRILVYPARSEPSDPGLLRARALAATSGAMLRVVDPDIGGPVDKVILAQVAAEGHDLIIKTARPIDRKRRVFGSVATRLMRKAPCPVWIVADQSVSLNQPVLAAIDVGDPVVEAMAADVFALAHRLAEANHAPLHVVHAWTYFGAGWLRSMYSSPVDFSKLLIAERRRHGRRFAAFLDQCSRRMEAARIHFIKGPAHRVIANLARDLDAGAVVAGTASRDGVAGWVVGNTAEHILHSGNASVIAVRDSKISGSAARPAQGI